MNDTPSRKNVWQMFDRIAPTYDILNHVLSFGQDILWRRRVARYLPSQHKDVLDVATGTADMLLSLVHHNPGIEKGVGVDISEGMLEIGRRKVAKKKLEGTITLHNGDAVALNFEDNSFDVVTIGFGIRNVVDVHQALTEMCRVLRPKGRVIVLECSMPQSRLVKSLYLLYFRHILPFVGKCVSGDGDAYRYLNRTVETFPCGEDFCELLRGAGMTNAQAHPLFLGVATIYVADCPA